MIASYYRYRDFKATLNGRDTTGTEMTTDPTILLVVEDEEISSAMSYLLEGNNFQTVQASSIKEATARAPREQFDLILLDLEIPLRDSLAAARHIRASAGKPDVPIVVVDTDMAKMSQTIDLAPASGEYILRLIDLDRLLNLLSYILYKYSDAAPTRP